MSMLLGTRRALLGGRAATPLWWDPNGEGLPVVGAYRAIATVGSPWPLAPAVYADTLQNWSNPGANDLVEGFGAVPWAAATGWGFVAAALQYFNTNLIPANDQSWTCIAQYAAVTNSGHMISSRTGGGREFRVRPDNGAGNVQYANGAVTTVPPALLAGNLCVSGNRSYRNGIMEGPVIGVWGGASLQPAFIGAQNNGGAPAVYISGNGHAAAIYDGILTAPQVLAVATAMAAL